MELTDKQRELHDSAMNSAGMLAVLDEVDDEADRVAARLSSVTVPEPILSDLLRDTELFVNGERPASP